MQLTNHNDIYIRINAISKTDRFEVKKRSTYNYMKISKNEWEILLRAVKTYSKVTAPTKTLAEFFVFLTKYL